MAQSANSRQERWKSEAEFFDEWAAKAEQDIAPTDPLALRRYSPPFRSKFHQEFCFQVMGSLRGKSVLDVGCGDGSNAVLLAQLGASVTGIDISPKAIRLATKRAEINGVKDSVRFCCSPLETADFSQSSFDVIWGDFILHHLIADLDRVAGQLTDWAKPGGLLLFREPVNFNNALRQLRLMLPVKVDGTPDERPLEPADVKIVRRHIPDLQVKLFNLFGRLNRFVIPSQNYERASLPRRAVSNSLATLDYFLLALPGVRRLGGTAVMYGHPRKE